MTGRSGDELLMGIAQILYLRYKLEQPLIPQVKIWGNEYIGYLNKRDKEIPSDFANIDK